MIANTTHMNINIDIIKLDKEIRNLITKNTVREQKELNILKLCYEKTIDVVLKAELFKQWNELETRVTKHDLVFYIHDVLEVLDDYKQYLKKPSKLSFMGKTETTHDNDIYVNIIKTYLKIASNYLQISTCFDHIYTHSYICENCGNKDKFVIINNELYICEICSCQQVFSTIDKTSYADIERINIATKYIYDRKSHFKECLDNFQGKQCVKIPDKILDSVKERLMNYKLHDDTLTTNKFTKVTKKNILNVLKELEYNKQYENVNLIYNIITGNPLPDLSDLSNKILQDFDSLSTAYDQHFSDISRKNFVNTHFVLYQILHSNGYECKLEDFTTLKTTDRKLFHEHVVKTLFEHLGWNYRSVF